MRTPHLRSAACAFALACALVAPAWSATPTTASGAHPAALDTLITRHLTYYEVYAPTEAQLAAAQREIQFALEQFGVAIGERAARVVFVVFANEAERARYDLAPVRRHLLPVVEYVGVIGAAPSRSDGAAVADARKYNPRSLAHQAGHAFFYEYVQSQLRKRGEPVDSIRATGDAARGAEAHRLHPRVPDWFEEAVATTCESPSTRTTRLRAMRQTLDRHIPLGEYFGMTMPASPAERAALFSNQALSMANFISAAENERFLGHIAVGLIEGKYIGQCLLDATTLYSKPEALDGQYVEWMKLRSGGPAGSAPASPAGK